MDPERTSTAENSVSEHVERKSEFGFLKSGVAQGNGVISMAKNTQAQHMLSELCQTFGR